MSEKKKDCSTLIVVIGVIVYILLMGVQNRVQKMDITYLNGIVAQIQNIVVILMTVNAHKKGFIASVVVSIISSLQTLVLGVIVSGSTESLPGVVIPLVMLLMAYVIYNYSSGMQKANAELSVTIDELNRSNATLIDKDEKLMYLAYHDLLTGLANKQLLLQTIGDKIEQSPNVPFNVLEVNIDNVKEITDKYGMNVADEIVCSYADRLKSVCGDKYFIACLNASRFVILVDGMQSQTDIATIANTINSVVSEPVVVKDVAFKTTMSYGVASYPNNAQTTDRLVQCANASVDYVVSRGGNNIKFYVDSQSVYVGA